MNFKKIALASLAGTMLMSAAAFAEGETFKAGFEGQFDTSVEGNFAEWQDLSSFHQEFKCDEEVTLKVDYGQKVAFSGNYVGLQTSVPVVKDDDGAVINKAKLISLSLDGEAVTINDDCCLTAEGFDGGVRINLTNQWNDKITTQPISADVWAGKQFQVIEAKFIVSASAEESEATGDVAPIAYLAALVAVAGIAMVASKKRA